MNQVQADGDRWVIHKFGQRDTIQKLLEPIMDTVGRLAD